MRRVLIILVVRCVINLNTCVDSTCPSSLPLLTFCFNILSCSFTLFLRSSFYSLYSLSIYLFLPFFYSLFTIVPLPNSFYSLYSLFISLPFFYSLFTIVPLPNSSYSFCSLSISLSLPLPSLNYLKYSFFYSPLLPLSYDLL